MDSYSYRRETEKEKESYSPSFSSTLLDAIYRSIDEGEEEEMVICREPMRKKQQSSSLSRDEGSMNSMADFQRLRMVEKWMEKERGQGVRRKSLADFVPKIRRNPEVFYSNSSWSSSDSSSGGGFSSSEAESVHGVSTKSTFVDIQRPKPTKTSVSVQQEKTNKQGKKFINMYHDDYLQGRDCNTKQQKPKYELGFVKTKSRALKIYGDLKKAKQPISPGGKLASFLNSLFIAGNAKSPKFINHDPSSERKLKSANSSTCSSASSFSRSCLSKPPSSRGKSSNTMKRSVRFYPVSVIVDEDSQPCGHKNLYEDEPRMDSFKNTRNPFHKDLNFHIQEKNGRDLLRSYQKREYDSRTRNVKKEVFVNIAGDDDDDDEEEEDDAASCCSSDLFELDNLSAIGMERYREELPVYETTHLDSNRSKGMIL